MKISTITLICFLGLLLWQTSAYSQTGIFVNLEGGWVKKQGLPSTSEANAIKCKQHDFPAARLGVGYLHDFNSFIGAGLEAGHGIYNKYTYHLANGNKLDAESSVTDFMGILMFHIKKVDIFGTFGGNRHTLDVTKVAGAKGKRDIQPEMMLGANYTIMPHFAVTLNYLHTFRHKGATIKNDNTWVAPSLNAIMAGIWITFF